MPEIQYVTPREVRDIKDCAFYHYMDLPEVGQVGDHWDLRETIDAYFGNFDFKGKKALDVGSASGYLTFEMEKRGADVTSFDIADGAEWNTVPFVNPAFDEKKLQDELSYHVNLIKNAYWYAHRALKSRAKAYYGDIYAIPEALGPFDVVMFGMVLPHLRDPFKALYSGARLSRDYVIVTQQAMEREEPVALFLPDPDKREDALTWWVPSEGCIEQMLKVVGFEVVSRPRARHSCPIRNHSEQCTTFVARRVHGRT
jgi:hypothetical protein